MDNTGYHEWHKTQQSKVLFIDSKDANKHTDTTHFTYVFNDSIEIKKQEGVLVSLLQASIPYSFYNVREGINDRIDILYGERPYDTFSSNLSTRNALIETVITLPAGNYTAISLANRFKSLLEEQMGSIVEHDDGSATFLPSKITIDFDRDTQKFNFSIEEDPDPDNSGYFKDNNTTQRFLVFNLSHGQNAAQHFDVEIGFDSDTATSSVFIESINAGQHGHGRISFPDNNDETFTLTNQHQGPLVSDNIADLNGSIHSLYLRSNLPVISSMDSLTGGVSSILSKIPIMVGPGSIIFHEPQNSIHKSLIQVPSIKFLTIRLTDDRNRLVSLNGLHFSVAIMFEFVSLKSHHPNFIPIPRTIQNVKKKKKNNKKKNVNQLYNKDAEIQTPSIQRDTIRQNSRQTLGAPFSEGVKVEVNR